MRALLWDMNGVLVDDEPIQEQALAAALAGAGIVLEEGWQPRFLGRKLGIVLAQLLPDLDGETRASLLAERRRHYLAACAAGLPPVPGAAALLAAAHARAIPQALVTSTGPLEMDWVLERLGLRELFTTLVCGADVNAGKPAPNCYLLAAARLSVPAGDCWVIEDSPFGVQAAQAAGMRAVALTTSLDAAALAGADIIVDRLDLELLDRLQSLGDLWPCCITRHL